MTERESEKNFEFNNYEVLDAFSQYMREVSTIPLLSREEEYILASRVQAAQHASEELSLADSQHSLSIERQHILDQAVLDGLEAREHMILANLRLVVSIVNRYKVSQDSKLDLIQEGNLGLARAVDKYDPTLGYKFSTYAFWHIRQKISRALKETSVIHVPHELVDKERRLFKARELLQQAGENPNDESLAKIANISASEVHQLQIDLPRYAGSLNDTLGEGATQRAEFIADPNAENEIESAISNIWSDVILPRVDLTERERKVVAMVCGLDGYEPSTLQQVGDCYGLTRERVRQIRNTAVGKILKVFKNPEDIEILLSEF